MDSLKRLVFEMSPAKKSPRRRPESTLRIPVYVRVSLLQRVEDALAKAGRNSRSDVVCELLDRWARERGC